MTESRWQDLGRDASRHAVRLLARIPGVLAHEVVAVGRRLARIRVIGLAAEIAFFGALAIVPMTLSVVTLLGALVGEEGEAAVLAAARRGASLALAGDAYTGVIESVERLVAGPRPGLLSLSVVLLLLFASRGLWGMMRGIALVYGTVERRSWWQDRLVAVGFTLAAVVLASGGLALVVVLPLIDLLGLGGPGAFDVLAGGAWRVTRVAVLGVLAVLFLTVLYHDARGWHGRWLRDLPGALLATGGAGLAAVTYRVAVIVSPRALARSGESEDLVGAVLLGILATLVLLALVAAAVLLGAAFNVEHDPDAPA